MLVQFVVCLVILSTTDSFHVSPIPCNVSSAESCFSHLYYVPKTPKTNQDTASLFRVPSTSVNRTINGLAVAVNCGCPTGHGEFISHVDYKVQRGDTWEGLVEKFGSFLVTKPDKSLLESQFVTLDLLCGCSKGVDVISYKFEKGDTLFTVCARFNASLERIVELNHVEDPSLIHAGDVIFIPDSGGLKDLLIQESKDPTIKEQGKSSARTVVIVLVTVSIVPLMVIAILCRYYYKRKAYQQSEEGSKCFPGYINPFHLQTKSGQSKNISFSVGRTTVFSYGEVRDATLNFRTSLKIGQGSYGLVYQGKLRGNDVAIKVMKNSKSREFLSELNVLRTIHHINLIELIGHAAGGESLFLVYELAENGALSDHLFNRAVKGYKPLTWTRRVKIALDVAKGLEYIHVHSKPQFVHRDVKSSNILLDSGFQAKLGDFGLVKLMEHSPDGGVAAASRIVGTQGYLAPEYVHDGRITTKIDVYAFGVVLMELMTGKPILSRDAGPGNSRSLVEYVLSLLEKDDPFTELTHCVDPTLFPYHKESLLQMAILAKDCVDQEWNRRPNMHEVVIRLRRVLKLAQQYFD